MFFRFYTFDKWKVLARTTKHIQKHTVYWRQPHLLLMYSSPLEQRLFRWWYRSSRDVPGSIWAVIKFECTAWSVLIEPIHHPLLTWIVLQQQFIAFINFLLWRQCWVRFCSPRCNISILRTNYKEHTWLTLSRVMSWDWYSTCSHGFKSLMTWIIIAVANTEGM